MTTTADDDKDDEVVDEEVVLPGNTAIKKFMDELYNNNIRRYIELPMICVMGDTSSGKSSILSALSMVELPTSHQLTTRCPILLKMIKSSEEERKASVSIQWNNNNNNNNNNDKKEEEEDFVFDTIELYKDDINTKLPDVILQAQDVILNHTCKEVSSDVIQVTVHSPECLDLVLLDLPGMVHTRGLTESESLVEDINDLITTYLSNPRCVILAVIAANVDYHNSQVLAMAQKVDPETKRTIPVITKPDLVDVGAEEEVVELLLGRKMKFELGFHICKGRGQVSLNANQSLETSLEEELEFFTTNKAWRDVPNRDLFGTVKLRQKLGNLQLSMIRRTIPSILKEIHEKQQSLSKNLKGMGKLHQTTADKRRYYQDYCQSYVVHLTSSLGGKAGTKNFFSKKKTTTAASKLHDSCTTFMKTISEGSLGTIKSVVEGAQVLITSTKGDIRGEVVHVGSKDYACIDYLDDKDHTIDVLFDYIGYQAQERLEEDDVWSDGSKVYIARKNNSFDLLKHIPLNRIRTDPSWLLERISDNRTADLGCFLNVDIFKSIVSDFIDQDWKPHCTALIHQASDIILSAMADSLEKSSSCREFSKRFPNLHVLIKQRSNNVARILLSDAEKQILQHLEMEKHPYTQDQILFNNIAASRYRGIQRELEVSLKLDQEGVVYETSTIQSILNTVFQRTQQKSVEHYMAEELEIVLESYGKVATKRVIDRTPMICWDVVRSLVPSIQDILWNITDVQLEETMMKDNNNKEFEKKYNALTEELDQMNHALIIFQSLL